MRHGFVRCASNDLTKPSKIFPVSPPPLPFEMAGSSTTGICTFNSSTIGSRCSESFCCIICGGRGRGGGGGIFWLLEIICKATSNSFVSAANS